MVVPENYKKVLQRFVETNNNKPVVFFAALKMDELVDKWSILVSLDWVNNENRREVFSSMITAIQENLDAEELDEIARIVFYTPDEHLIGLFKEKFTEGQHIKEDAKVNGNVIHEGYIIALKKNEGDNQERLL